MNVLVAETVTRSYGDRILFSEVTLGLERGEKVALIARNGSGKTTLLDIIAGLEVSETGKVVLRDGYRLAYVRQEPGFFPEATVKECLLDPNNPAVKAYLTYQNALSVNNDAAITAAMEDMDAQNAWELESQLNAMRSKLDLPEETRQVKTLSGGQLRRVALAAALVQTPDILILDEPTNHLDLPMIEWLEDILAASNLTLLMVTHDRYFLDRVCQRIVALEEGRLFTYNGDYAYYLEKRAEQIASRLSEVEKAQNTYRRELEWVRRMPKARGTKSKSRLDAFEDIKAKAFSLKKQRELDISMRMKRMGSKILELIKIKKGFGDQVLIENFTYSFRRGERIGIVGPNGSGKTTLLKMILGDLEPDAGKIVVGETLEFGHYRQENSHLPEDKRVIELVKEVGEVFENERYAKASAAQLLQQFEFGPDLQYNYVKQLSGGERRKLSLLLILLKQPNFLILDEPTNDLDLATLQAMEAFLENYAGCVIMVSHDRYFMDRLVDQLFVFEGKGKVNVFGGSYSEYRAAQAEQQATAKALKEQEKNKQPEPAKASPAAEKSVKLSFNEKRDLELLPEKIEALEKERDELTAQISSGTLPHDEINTISGRLAVVSEQIETMSNRWLELADRAGSL